MSNFPYPISQLNTVDAVMTNTITDLANVNTDGFTASRIIMQSGPFRDEGVRVGALFRDMFPGPAIINHLAENDLRDVVDVAAAGMRISEQNYDTSVAQDVDRLAEANTWDAWRAQNYRDGADAQSTIDGTVLGFNRDIGQEFSTYLTSDTAYTTSAANIRAWDDFTGSIFNVKI